MRPFGAPQGDLRPVQPLARVRPTHRRDNTPATRAAEPQAVPTSPKKCRSAPARSGRRARCAARTTRPVPNVSDTRQTNRAWGLIRVESDVHNSNGERERAKSSHRPDRSPRSSYARDDRWDDSKMSHPPSAAPDPLIRRLRRCLALAGVPAPKNAPFSTSTSALTRVQPLHGHVAKGQG